MRLRRRGGKQSGKRARSEAPPTSGVTGRIGARLRRTRRPLLHVPSQFSRREATRVENVGSMCADTLLTPK